MTAPLVTCIMPTYNRRRYVPSAIEYFLRQDYAAKELIVVDDGDDSVVDLIPNDPRVRYVRLDERMALGAKRNLACQEAEGDLIVHWDDDDWSASWRLSYQVAGLLDNDAEVCGLRSLFFYDVRAERGWRYSYPATGRPWVAGGTLCYRKDLWKRHRFPEIRQGEDTQFLWSGRPRRLVALDDERFYVALIHRRNTSRKTTSSRRWTAVPGADVLAVMGGDAGRYGRATPARIAPPLPEVKAVPSIVRSRRVLIGVTAHAEPRQLAATLASIREGTKANYSVVVLADGPTPALRRAISASGLPSSESARPSGRAASFNRLVSRGDADVYILLESGVRVGPEWLTRLVAALDAHPANGIAGPTTNTAWNEQGRFPHLRGTNANIVRTARYIAQQYGESTAMLDPLYSLGDFCYAVSKEVVDTIGAADEKYGLGPCWEMDYNIRAARAGFKGVWARGAYVHRSAPTARRQRDESRYFAASRSLYQAKFCFSCPRARANAGQISHCRGDSCAAFAPAEAIEIRLPFVERLAPDSIPRDGEALPLVSCIMPTSDRHLLARRAAEYFRRQTYPNLELIIVDDGEPGLVDLLPQDARIKYTHVSRRLSIGEKRNLACESAGGGIIAQWDDDDWYSVDRLSRQVMPIVEGRADMTGLSGGLFLDLAQWKLMSCSAKAHRVMFAGDVIGGTLVYDKALLRRVAYPDRSIAEDAQFLRRATRGGARLARITNDGLFVYVRHGGNTWQFPVGKYLGEANWTEIAETVLPPEDLDFYSELRRELTASPAIAQ